MEGNHSLSLLESYKVILEEAINNGRDGIAEHLSKELPHTWIKAYQLESSSVGDICIMRHGTFEYIFDDYSSLEITESMKNSILPETRVVGVFGLSAPKKIRRDDYRLRGWIGSTEHYFGKDWDKGHFIAHSIGGAVDGMELNVFQQRRDLNRGWSQQGKIFRKMEKYCFDNPGTFCFNRPIYFDTSFKPAFYEFGVLMPDGQLWVELFDNQNEDDLVDKI